MNQASTLPEPSEKTCKLEQTYKQFSLETERLEMIFDKLQHQFTSVQANLQETHLKLYGKLAELDFVTHYLNAILQHISQGILFVDLQGMMTTYNPVAEKTLGLPYSHVLFHSFWDVFSDEAFGFSLRAALQSKQVPHMCFVNWASLDEKIMELEVEATWVEMGAHLYPVDLQGPQQASIQGLLILIRNVTDIRRFQRMAHRNQRLQELGEWAAMVAHEIRNPLGGIKGFASLLQQDLQNRPELQQMATAIVQGTEGLNRFVTAILNYTRPFQPHFELVDLSSFLKEMIELIKADKAFHGEVTCQFKTSLSPFNVPVDASLLKSALLNILINALQAMPQGGELVVELDHIGQEAVIKIKDSGVGIAEEHIEKIFSPFFTTKESGNGFGLAEVHKVIQAHHGNIEVESQVGRGTQFTIKLPLKTS